MTQTDEMKLVFRPSKDWSLSLL